MTEIRDKLISKSIRMCWNPDCGYAMAISKTICVKCCWTSHGPPSEVTSLLENPVGRSFIGIVKVAGKTEPRDRSMNKEEAKYALRLEAMKSQGRIIRYRFEAVKLRLADRTYLTMDFMVQLPSGLIEFHDVKAFWKKAGKVGIEEDANVKMKVAAEQYPEWTFKAVWEKGGDWQERTF